MLGKLMGEVFVWLLLLFSVCCCFLLLLLLLLFFSSSFFLSFFFFFFFVFGGCGAVNKCWVNGRGGGNTRGWWGPNKFTSTEEGGNKYTSIPQ